MASRRSEVSYCIEELACLLESENKRIVGHAHPFINNVLCSGGYVKNISLMREIQLLCGSPDWGAVPYLLTGLPLLGPADPVDGMLKRTVQSQYSVKTFSDSFIEQQLKVLSRVKGSGDDELDKRAYKKSVDENTRGVLGGPFRSLDELPFDNPCLVPRHGIWEQHGGAEESTVRVIDDLLLGG
jgi:hypothetical protein